MNHQETIIEQILQWVDGNLTHPIRINDIALRSGYSKWHLQRLFLKVTSKKIGEYVRERRLDEALKALLSSHCSIMNIGLDFGFCSQQSFTRAFTRKYGMPPGEYRRRHYGTMREIAVNNDSEAS